MLSIKKLLNPASYYRFARERFLRRHQNLRGIACFPAGHFYSPLLDLEGLGPGATRVPFDGAEWWEHVDLRRDRQQRYYEDLVNRFSPLAFPNQREAGFRYWADNLFFSLSDAFTLSGVLRREMPRRIVEVGSGFSSAVMVDTLRHARMHAGLTFIEPHPDRLFELLSPEERSAARVLVRQVQEVPMAIFEELDAQDILFIDSSHVAKVGSDVSYLLLRVLPRLKRGVLVHFHDIFYPDAYPLAWVRAGRAWNESLFLRAFLIGNPQFEVIAFNSFAAHSFPEVFQARFPEFLRDPGASFWVRKVA